MASKNDAPANDDPGLPYVWRHLLEQEVGWHLEDDVGDLRTLVSVWPYISQEPSTHEVYRLHLASQCQISEVQSRIFLSRQNVPRHIHCRSY
jgi:hypothetical protein